MNDKAHMLGAQSLLPERIENSRSLLVVLMLMAFLAGLALLFARGATHLSDSWRAQLTDTATVQIIHSSSETRDTEMTAAMELLRPMLTNAEIAMVSKLDSEALLRPWLGETALPDDLPVPSLITIRSQAPINKDAIKSALEAEGLLVNIDDHTRFSEGIKRTSTRLIALGTGLLTILLGAGLAVSIFATRAGLSAQRDIIRVLVQVGASNRFIANLFISQAGRRGLIGALFGLALAALLWGLISLLGMAGDMGWGGLGHIFVDIVWLIALGLLFAGICALAAGVTATRQLARERRRA